MKKAVSIIILIVLLALVIAPVGCTRVGSSLNGSGKIIDQDYKISGFNAINVKGDFELEIIQSESFKVTVSTDDNLVNRIQITLDHRTLKFNIEAPATFFPTRLKAHIEMPSIIGMNLSEGAKAAMGGFKSDNEFSLFLSQGSTLTGNIEATIAHLNLSGGSQTSLKGTALSLDLDCKDASKLDLEGFAVTSADVNMNGASEAVLNVSGKFDAVLNENSKVYYLGNPLFYDTNISGGSSMIHK